MVHSSGKLLSENGDLSVEDVRTINVLRFEALFRMKMYDDLNVELASVLSQYVNNASTDFEHSSVLNFTVASRLLQSEVKLMTGHSIEALEHFDQLQCWLESLQISNNCRKTYWLWHIKCHILNSNIRSRNWKGSLKLLRNMVHLIDNLLSTNSNGSDSVFLHKAKVILLLRSAKILLQVSDIMQ